MRFTCQRCKCWLPVRGLLKGDDLCQECQEHLEDIRRISQDYFKPVESPAKSEATATPTEKVTCSEIRYSPEQYHALISQAWTLLADGKIEECVRSAIKVPDEADWIRKITAFLDFPYEEIRGVSQDVRRQFGLMHAWSRLVVPSCKATAQSGERISTWYRTELLGSLVGTPYELRIAPEARIEASAPYMDRILFMDEKLIPYKVRQALFPDLSILRNLSLDARTAFIRAVMYAKPTGMVEYRRLRLLGNPWIEMCLAALQDAGLLDPNPSDLFYLMNATSQQLRKVCYDQGLKTTGPKIVLCRDILERLPSHLTKDILDQHKANPCIRLTVAEIPKLKRHIWSERTRLQSYLSWVEHRLRAAIEPGSTEIVVSSKAAKDEHDRWSLPIENLFSTNYFDKADSSLEWRKREIAAVSEVWNVECDNIVIGLVQSCGWYAGWHIADEIAKVLKPETLNQLKKAPGCWNNMLMRYGCARIGQLGAAPPSPRLLTCARCAREFLENTIHSTIAHKVHYRLLFCNVCYGKAMYRIRPSRVEVKYRKRDMLKSLRNLAKHLGTIPTSNFMQTPRLSDIDEALQIQIVNALIDTPPYESYVKLFGSWFKAITAAGLLKGGSLNGGRGTRCIARDGHECLSLVEKNIDDWLFNHHIPHKKEPKYPPDAELNPSGMMRADWEVAGYFIEYAGMAGEPDYDAKMNVKQELASKKGIPLIILGPNDALTPGHKLRVLIENHQI